ncbi:MAG TPA: hypothetical protein PLO56_07625 [Rhodothermales bacterium]|nr:hypothetical protein [Rhodothermales bacterium]
MNTTLNSGLTLRRVLSLVVLVFFGLSSNGCDFLAEKLGVDQVTVPMDEFATDLPVADGSIGYSSGEVDLGSVKLPNVFEADEIRLETDQLVFTETADALGKTAGQNGILLVTINIQGYCAGQVRLTITNSAVSAISPNPVKIGGCAELIEYYDLLPTTVKTKLAANFYTATPTEAAAAINAALRKLRIAGLVTVRVLTGSLRGKITLKKADIKLKFK